MCAKLFYVEVVVMVSFVWNLNKTMLKNFLFFHSKHVVKKYMQY